MKGVVIYAEYDEGTGVSTVTKATKYGTFTRSVKVNHEDKDIANQFDGCLFAEMKCDIAAYQEKAKFMRERAKGIRHAYNVVTFSAIQSGMRDSFDYGALAQQCDVAQKLADDAFETVRCLKEGYDAFITNRLKSRREFRNRDLRKKKFFDI